MRILVLHNRYQQSGGEDSVVRTEASLLGSMGHAVELLEENNDTILRWTDAARTAVQCVYSPSSARNVRASIQAFRPDVVHVHNFFPRLSPSVHFACHRAGVPVIQTLHNYRLLCPAATFLRDNRVCEECLGKQIPWPAVCHGCYRHSKAGSATVAGMLAVHRVLKTWQRKVTRFIALTDFARDKFIEGGLPAEKIVVKPNCLLNDPGVGNGDGGYALFVGRLSEEKGLRTLLQAWEQLPDPPPLKIVGDGPLASLQNATGRSSAIEWLGACDRSEVFRLMAKATVLILPSICYEGAPVVLIEAFAVGLPVIASRIGAIGAQVHDGETGRLFTAGNSTELAAAVRELFANAAGLTKLRRAARYVYEQRFSPEAGYRQLMAIYEQAITSHSRDQYDELPQ